VNENQIETIDSHAHLTDERLAPEAAAVMERACAAGVSAVVTIGTGVEDAGAAVALAADLPGVYAGIGIHPHAADHATPDALSSLEQLARNPRVVAIGETGLDYFYDNAPRDAQRRAFVAQLDLGRRLGLPVIVHTRSADDDTTAVLREAGTGTIGVLHCFSGGAALMDAALDLGWYISFAGMITFPKYADADLVRRVPLDRILVETDSPYLAPVPKRGRRNEPAFVAHVARAGAAIRGEDAADFAAATVRNTRRLYRLDGGAAG
jgi:TatD DNase family protein